MYYLIVYLIILPQVFAEDAMAPNFQHYQAFLRRGKIGVGVNPIERFEFLIMPQFDKILLPKNWKSSGEHDHGEACSESKGHKVFLDLGGPKPFLSSGCSLFDRVGMLGLGQKSNIWDVFDGYDNKGGRILLHSNPQIKEGKLMNNPPQSFEEMRNLSFVYDARENSYTQTTSYISRKIETQSSVTFLTALFLYVYFRSKVTRKLVFPWKESSVSLFARYATAGFLLISIPVMMEYLGGRSLLQQDVGWWKTLVVSLNLYYTLAMLLFYCIMRIILRNYNEETIAKLELIGNLSNITASLFGAWIALLWRLHAQDGAFISSAILAMLFYEQTVVMLISIAKSATHNTGILMVMWMFAALPIYGISSWIAIEWGIFAFIEGKLLVDLLNIKILVWVIVYFLIFVAITHVAYGIEKSSRTLIQQHQKKGI